MPRHWIVALLLSLCALASPPTSITVAVDSNYPPYAFIGKNGELQGYTIERWKLWSHYTKIPVRFIYGDWAKMQQLVLEGKADVIDTIFKTPERLGLYRFSEPYADLPVAIFTHNIDRDIDDISSLKGKRIGVKEADANINYLRHHGIDNFTTYPNYEAIILAALNNEIDIFCMDEPPAFYFIAKSGRSEEFRHALHLYTGQFHYAVATNKEELLPLIEKGFSAIPASKIENIREQWLGTTTLNGRWKTITLYILAAALILTLLFLLWIAMLRWQVKKRTAQIDEERQRLHTLIHTIPDPVWITNLEGVFISCNKAFAQLVNKSEAEIVGKTDYDLVSEASADLFYAQDKKVLESTLPVTSEVTFQSPYSGETIYLEIIKSVVRNASGSVIGILGIARDVTERKKAQEELLRINATLEQRIEEELRRRRQQEELIIQQGRNIAISDTLGTIAHHWRQPLNLLALYLQNIKEEL
ncbi:MAG: transporter substrate-binding domain-containing protein, partial [Campylobacterales bacterium]